MFFEVQPGKSFHSVEEVVVGGERDEEGRARLSISGWFHAAQEGGGRISAWECCRRSQELEGAASECGEYCYICQLFIASVV